MVAKVEMVYWLGWAVVVWCSTPLRSRMRSVESSPLATVACSAVMIWGAEGSVRLARKIFRQLEAPEPARTSCT